ncbi:DUF6966 domain-containing protein [Propionibacterium australiense]|uniref:DUF6966 domain-containing protein n=1 Tax=Propionibacterium australiense TaxID=119981 RepID=UPI000F84BD5C|nr:hypothetical protein [Propionibacterium australiense]
MGVEMNRGLVSILTEITNLFRGNDDDVHLRQFEELCLRAKDANSAEDQSSLARIILRLYGGMGSFNDAIIYKNGVIDKLATNKLDSLRNDLFETVGDLL